MKSFRHKINGDKWIFSIIGDDEKDKYFEGDDSGAETDGEEKTVIFLDSQLSKSVVLHELWHVYFHYCYLQDSDVKKNDMEEISATMFENKAEQMIKDGRVIFKKLKTLDNGVNKNDKKMDKRKSTGRIRGAGA